jgi:hypothetical protein
MRVEFKTDARNLRVRGALLGIDATFEGIFCSSRRSSSTRAYEPAYVEEAFALRSACSTARASSTREATPSL